MAPVRSLDAQLRAAELLRETQLLTTCRLRNNAGAPPHGNCPFSAIQSSSFASNWPQSKSTDSWMRG